MTSMHLFAILAEYKLNVTKCYRYRKGELIENDLKI